MHNLNYIHYRKKCWKDIKIRNDSSDVDFLSTNASDIIITQVLMT